jgi:hypothetical protein
VTPTDTPRSLCGGLGDARLGDKPAKRIFPAPILIEPRVQLAAEPGHGLREFVAASRRFAEPEWDGGRHAMGVLDAHDPPFNAQDSIGGVAQLEDVSSHAFDSEVFVHSADDLAFRLQEDLEVRRVGDGSSRCQSRQTRAAPAFEYTVHGVVVNERPAPAAAAHDALGKHTDYSREILMSKVAIRPGPPDKGEHLLLAPILRREFGDNLLRKHVERPFGNEELI